MNMVICKLDAQLSQWGGAVILTLRGTIIAGAPALSALAQNKALWEIATVAPWVRFDTIIRPYFSQRKWATLIGSAKTTSVYKMRVLKYYVKTKHYNINDDCMHLRR